MDKGPATEDGPAASLFSFTQSSLPTSQGIESSEVTLTPVNRPLQLISKPDNIVAMDGSSANPSPAQHSPTSSTPEIANAIGGRLKLDSVSNEDDSEDSIMDDMSDGIYFDEQPWHGLPISTLPTGLCYDDRMRYHAEVANESNYHPEDPRRIFYIYKELCEAGLVDDVKTTRPLVRQPLFRIDAREATEEECCLIHTSKHYEFIKHTSGEI